MRNAFKRPLVLDEQGLMNDVDQLREAVRGLTELVNDILKAPLTTSLNAPTIRAVMRDIHAVSCTECGVIRAQVSTPVTPEDAEIIRKLLSSLSEAEEEVEQNQQQEGKAWDLQQALSQSEQQIKSNPLLS